ncbi:MAG: caspase family protein [Chloroflexota bacterium]
MSETFKHGYALVVGVDENIQAHLALPAVLKDVQAVHDVLLHPERCAYEADHVQFLKGAESTRDGIFDALTTLQDQVNGDDNATAVIYYSGHGWRNKETDQYYLIPYDIKDMTINRLHRYVISAEDFSREISAIRAKRLLVVLDCCHAGGMGVKSLDVTAVEPAAFPLEISGIKEIPDFEDGAKNVSDLADGEGRAVLNSSTGIQQSYVRNDGKMSLFTYHFIEALTGHAPHADDATVVYVTDVMSWVTHKVKQSAQQQHRDQTPVMRTTGVFPIAQLLGGQGLAKGMTAPDPIAPLPAASQTTVHGNQFNIGGSAQVGQIGDTINTGGGDYVGGDNVVHGDVVNGEKVAGSKVGGDQISVGDISGGQGIAIGRNSSASVSINEGLTGDALNGLFAPLVQAVGGNDTAVAKVEALKGEVAKGEEADDNKVANLISDIVEAAPTVVEGVVNLFANSIVAKAAGSATKFVLGRIKT